MKVYLGHTMYNNFKRRWECRVTAQHDDGHIAKGTEVHGTTKQDTEIEALHKAGEFSAEYGVNVTMES